MDLRFRAWGLGVRRDTSLDREIAKGLREGLLKKGSTNTGLGIRAAGLGVYGNRNESLNRTNQESDFGGCRASFMVLLARLLERE